MPRKSQPQKSLGAVLRIKDDVRFMSALTDWVWNVPGRRSIPFDEIPEPGRMIVVLDGVLSAINSAGLLYVLDWQVGDHYHEAVGWCKRIGARRAAAYLAAGAALFPRGRVPSDAAKRRRASAPLTDDREIDRLGPIDDRYREAALGEIPERLRAYLAKHAARVERELAPMARERTGTSSDDLLLDERNTLANLFLLLQMYQRRERAGKLEDPTPEVVRVGDLVELPTPKGFAYLHATHEHALWRVSGPVVRVLAGTFKRHPTAERLTALVAGETVFHTLFNVNLAVEMGEATIVRRRVGVPKSARAFPTFLFHWGKTRDGRAVWGLWTGGETPVGHVVGPLRGEHRTWPVLLIRLPAEELAEQIVTGWRPDDELRDWGDK